MCKSCSNCGNCLGWDDQGYGVGEYTCAIPDEDYPGCDAKGDCPAWIPIGCKRTISKRCYNEFLEVKRLFSL